MRYLHLSVLVLFVATGCSRQEGDAYSLSYMTNYSAPQQLRCQTAITIAGGLKRKCEDTVPVVTAQQ